MNFSRDLFARAAALLVFAASSIAQATTFTVTQNADCAVGSGVCCLRTAVWAANNPGAVACGQTSTGNNDIIQLGGANAKSLTVSGANGAINITKSMTIKGNYQGLHADNATVKITGSGGQSNGIFKVPFGNEPITLVVQYLRITNSQDLDTDGGAISVPYAPTQPPQCQPPNTNCIHHTVSLRTVQIDNCSGFNGGAVNVEGYLNVDADQPTGSAATSFHDNVAAFGGAIYTSNLDDTLNEMWTRINNSTFTKNYANQNGGFGDGGALYLLGTVAKITNSVFGGSSTNANKAGPGTSGNGGAIMMLPAGTARKTYLLNNSFSWNLASASGTDTSGGGALYANSELLVESNNTFDHNKCNRVGSNARCLGGAIYAIGAGYVEIFQSNSFTNNSVGSTGNGNGGAVYTTLVSQNTTASNAVFSGNIQVGCDRSDPEDPNGYCGEPQGNCPDHHITSCPKTCADNASCAPP